MAQCVGYYEDDVVYEEGPFVLVSAGGWRIEAEVKGHKCPALPDLSIFRLIKNHFGDYQKSSNLKKVEERCDFLNKMVKSGDIVLDNGQWISPKTPW